MKILLFILGSLLAVFCAAQLLQLLGLIGVKGGSGLAGMGITLLSGACAALCFRKAKERA